MWHRASRSALEGFYRDVVGVPIEYSDPHEPENVPHYETMWGDEGEAGPVEPHLWFNLFMARDGVTSGASLSFPVPSVAEAHACAEADGFRVAGGQRDVPWGVELILIDPDGNRVVLTER